MEKVRPWCGQPSDRGRLKNRTEQNRTEDQHATLLCIYVLTYLRASNLAKLAASTEDERGQGNNMSEPNGQDRSFSR